MDYRIKTDMYIGQGDLYSLPGNKGVVGPGHRAWSWGVGHGVWVIGVWGLWYGPRNGRGHGGGHRFWG